MRTFHTTMDKQPHMKIAIVGAGRMGTVIARVAETRGHRVISTYDSTRPLPDPPSDAGSLDAVIDFSTASAVPRTIDICSREHIPLVIGTTAWNDHIPAARELVLGRKAACLFAPNFSLGVALLDRALRSVVPLLERLDDFDLYIHETHHTGKADSPSGTAHHLAQRIVGGLSRKSRIETETQHGRIAPESLHITSTRAGSVFGEHEVRIDGPADHLTLTHAAKSREGFAAGAVIAAEWLQGRTGFFTLEDMLEDWTRPAQHHLTKLDTAH